MSPLYVLREKDRFVYVVGIDTFSDEPVVSRRWYPTGIKAYNARQNIGDFDGTILKSVGGGRYEIPPPTHTYSGHGIVVELTNRGATVPDQMDQIEVASPKTRRKGTVFWRLGEWWIAGTQGEEILAKVNLRDYVMP